MRRATVAVVAGFALWSALWLGGGALVGVLFPDEMTAFEAGEALGAPAVLAVVLALSVLCSLASGAVTASVGRERARGATLALAVVLLAVGLVVQLASWSRMPVAYHVAFLAALVPVTLAGARLVPRGRAGSRPLG